MASLWRNLSLQGLGVECWASSLILGVQAMVESQRLRSLLQAGRSFPALSSILAPPSVEWVPSMLLSSVALRVKGKEPGA